MVKGYQTGNKQTKQDQEELRKKEKEDKKRREAAYFREVFGPPSARSEAQKFVAKWLDHEGYQNRSVMIPQCTTNEMYGRIGVRELYLVIKELADRPIEYKPIDTPKVDRSGF